jgi:hypothetical protein
VLKKILLAFLGGATHSMVMGISHSGRCYFGLVDIKQGVEWFIEFLPVFITQESGFIFWWLEGGVDTALPREQGSMSVSLGWCGRKSESKPRAYCETGP